MKKLLLGAILLFSVISCTTNEKTNETSVDNVVTLNKDLLNVKPNPTNSFIIKANFSMKSDRGTYILEEYIDGTFKNIPEYLNNNEGSLSSGAGGTMLMLVSIDKSNRASVGSYTYNPLTNPDSGIYPLNPLNFIGNGYAGQERTGTITDIGSNYFTITYTNKYEYYSYITKANKTATKIDKRTFTF